MLGLAMLAMLGSWSAAFTPPLTAFSRSAQHVPLALPARSRLSCHAAAVSADAAAEGEKPSALVLGWFFASKRELEYVRKAYDKNGFDVTIQPSIVNVLAKPRGWYRTLRRRLQPNRKTPEPEPHALGRKFDVVHCLSGGFLSLYVLRRSRVALTFQTLVRPPAAPGPPSWRPVDGTRARMTALRRVPARSCSTRRRSCPSLRRSPASRARTSNPPASRCRCGSSRASSTSGS